MPLSWRHYVYGKAYLARAYLREQLAWAQATRIAGFKQADFDTWQRDTNTVTEVPRG